MDSLALCDAEMHPCRTELRLKCCVRVPTLAPRTTDVGSSRVPDLRLCLHRTQGFSSSYKYSLLCRMLVWTLAYCRPP